MMQIWPAIDLLEGRCVRLKQGDYQQNTIFGEDPAAMAQRWLDAGAEFLHLVDLDGAKSGSLINEAAIRSIATLCHAVPVQVGGGVRNQATMERLFELGVARVIVGTSALKDPEWFAAMCESFPGRLVLGLDARDGMVATQGWLKTSSVSALALVAEIQQLTDDVAAVVYTDISRDGMLAGPNWEGLQSLKSMCQIPIIASGGVTTLDDIDRLLHMEIPGCIIGRSLYEGQLDLSQVLQRVRGDHAQRIP